MGIDLKPLDDAIAWAEREAAGQHVDGDPTWKQDVWVDVNECGTACCIAGRIALAAGYEPIAGQRGEIYDMLHPETGDRDDVDMIARKIVLGNSAGEHFPLEVWDELTAGENSLSDVRRHRDVLARLAESG